MSLGSARNAPSRLLVGIVAFVGLLLALAAPSPTLAQEVRFPAMTGRVVDGAGLLSSDERQRIEATLKGLESKSSDQLVVVTLRSLEGLTIEDYGYRLGRAWGIGQQGTNNGVLLLVAPAERKVRIEVGRGLEGQLTDALSSLIVQNALLPAFRRGDWSGGIEAAVRDMSDVLLGDAQAVKDRLSRLVKRGGETDWQTWIPVLIWLLMAGLILYAHWRQSRAPPGAPGARRRASTMSGPIFVPGGWSGGGHWGGGSGGSSDGGFGGGGGDFGGGGSSGTW
jgi:uncharacterized protein